MKKVMNKSKAIIIAMVTLISTSFSNTLSAMNKKIDPPVVEIKYLGIQDKNPIFEISTNSADADNFFITIRDRAGNILYSEKLAGKSFSRRYRIDTQEEITDGGLRFEVRAANSKKTEVYVVGVNENVTREVAVNKIQ